MKVSGVMAAYAQPQPLRERRAAAQRREQMYIHTLESRKKTFECVKRKNRQKKKPIAELMERLDTTGISGKMLRNPEGHRPKSHNLDRQLIDLLKHMFVEYKVPAFLYGPCMKQADPFAEQHEMYRQWFVTLAQGASFPKLVKHCMTSKEAYLFLSAPCSNLVHENVWWAKLRAAGVGESVADVLIRRLFTHFFFDDPDGRLAEAIHFYAKYHQEMNRVTLGEVNDFIAWQFRNEPEFRLRGRTAASVIRLTNEWHAQMKGARIYSLIRWDGLQLPEWEHTARGVVWKMTELRNNRELLQEGRKQRHCVYSYVQNCAAGRTYIFSMRGYPKVTREQLEDGLLDHDPTNEVSRITIEVNSRRTVVQVKGRLNRMPDADESKCLNLWATDRGLRMDDDSV